MAEMNNELRVFEAELIAARCKLRQLNGKIGLYLQQEHTSSVPGIESANDKSAKAMQKIINESLLKLDQYDLQRDYLFEKEKGYEKICSFSLKSFLETVTL